VTGAIVTINFPGDRRKNNDRMLRAVTEDGRVETIRNAVTEMMKDPASFLIGSKAAKSPWRTKAYKPDEEVLPGVAVDATVERLTS
jgi:hypothetical protein